MDSFSYGSPYIDSLAEKYNCVKMLHETFDNVIVPKFKGNGFRKNGKTFYRQRDDLIEVCTVQFSRDNSCIHAWFIFHIEIAIPSLYDSLDSKYTKKWEATIFDIDTGSLIGWENGVSDCGPLYYMLDLGNVKLSDASPKEIARGESGYVFLQKLESRYNRQTGEGFNEIVSSDIENTIIKFFSSIPSAQKLIEHVDNEEPNGYADEAIMESVAIFYYRWGEQEKAKKILKKIQNGYLKDEIQKFVNRAGIIL